MASVPAKGVSACQVLLFGLEQIDWTSSGKTDFEEAWVKDSSEIVTCVENDLRLRPRFVAVLNKYLDTDPVVGVYGVQIGRSSHKHLQQLEVAYDVWALLASLGHRRFIRGKETPWNENERPMVESYRWEVKARLARPIYPRTDMIDRFRKAAVAASEGPKHHCGNRARHMEAYAVRHEAHDLVANGDFDAAIELFDKAKALAGETGHADLIEFYRWTAALRSAEANLQFSEALDAHKEATTAIARFSNPDTLFRIPNPWTSYEDFLGERDFITTIRSLEMGTSALRDALGTVQRLVNIAQESHRRTHLLACRFCVARTASCCPVRNDRAGRHDL